MVTLQEAYKIAKNYQNQVWKDFTQIQLWGVAESENEWIFRFIPFIPKKDTEFDDPSLFMVHGIIGCYPTYYGGDMCPIEVVKETGECYEVWFHALDYERRAEYFSKFSDVDRMQVFSNRISQGQGYSFRSVGVNVYADFIENDGDVVKYRYGDTPDNEDGILLYNKQTAELSISRTATGVLRSHTVHSLMHKMKDDFAKGLFKQKYAREVG